VTDSCDVDSNLWQDGRHVTNTHTRFVKSHSDDWQLWIWQHRWLAPSHHLHTTISRFSSSPHSHRLVIRLGLCDVSANNASNPANSFNSKNEILNFSLFFPMSINMPQPSHTQQLWFRQFFLTGKTRMTHGVGIPVPQKLKSLCLYQNARTLRQKKCHFTWPTKFHDWLTLSSTS